MALKPDEENFWRTAQIVLRIIPCELRNLFEKQWNAKYPTQPWDNTSISGKLLLQEYKKLKKSWTKIPFKEMEQVLQAGDVSKWDCSTLFFVLLNSELNLIAKKRDPNKRKQPLLMSENIDSLREIRNRYFAHLSDASISTTQYTDMVTDVERILTENGMLNATNQLRQVKIAPIETIQSQKLRKDLQDEKQRNDEYEQFIFDVEYELRRMNESINESRKEITKLKLYKRMAPREIKAVLKSRYKTVLANCYVPLLSFEKKERPFGGKEYRRCDAMVKICIVEDSCITAEMINERSEFLSRIETLIRSQLEIKDIFLEDEKVCLIRGIAGIGKTWFLDYMTLMWAENRIFNEEQNWLFKFISSFVAGKEISFQYVFRLTCREMNHYRGRKVNVADLFNDLFCLNIDDLRHVRGENVLFIIDGFDEYFNYESLFRRTHKEEDITNIFRNLIQKDTSIFPGHYTLMAGRPHAINSLRGHEKDLGKLKIAEILGFSEESIQQYVDVFCNGDKDMVKHIKDRLNESNLLKTIAHIPIFLCSTCSILKLEGNDKQKYSLRKITDLYAWTFCLFLRNHFCHAEGEFAHMALHNILNLQCVKKLLQILSKISYELLLEKKIVFDYGEFKELDAVDEDCKRLLDGFIVKTEDEFQPKYQFIHLTMQEFLAAFYCVTDGIEASSILENNWLEVLVFMAGFLGTLNGNSDGEVDILSLLLTNFPLQPHQREAFSCVLYTGIINGNSTSGTRSSLYMGVMENHLLKIFYEIYDVGNALPECFDFSTSRNNTVYFVVNDATSFEYLMHFCLTLVEGGRGIGLSGIILAVFRCTISKNGFYNLARVIPHCKSLYLFRCSLAVGGTILTSLNENSAFEAIEFKLKGLYLFNCSMSAVAEETFATMVPVVEKFGVFPSINYPFLKAITDSFDTEASFDWRLKTLNLVSPSISAIETVEKLAHIMLWVKEVRIANIEYCGCLSPVSLFENLEDFLLKTVLQHQDPLRLENLHITHCGISSVCIMEMLTRILPFIKEVVLDDCGLSVLHYDRLAERMNSLRNDNNYKEHFKLKRITGFCPKSEHEDYIFEVIKTNLDKGLKVKFDKIHFHLPVTQCERSFVEIL